MKNAYVKFLSDFEARNREQSSQQRNFENSYEKLQLDFSLSAWSTYKNLWLFDSRLFVIKIQTDINPS